MGPTDGSVSSTTSIKPTTSKNNPRPPPLRSNAPGGNRTSPTKTSNKVSSGPAPPVIRPGTYKKSEGNNNRLFHDPPTREDIVTMIERDVAFSDPNVRSELMDFIK